MITMVLGGLWHGASWQFVAWGSYHGVLLCAYRGFGKYWDMLPMLIQRVGTFVLVIVGWTFFRAVSWDDALALLRRMFIPTPGVLLPAATGLVAMLLLAGAIAHLAPNTFQISHRWRPAAAIGLAGLLLLALVRLQAGAASPFLYFQF
jgi:D-alanyl-lipoteichoic acid acyltransferase DltB (MBOAT superfamily)